MNFRHLMVLAAILVTACGEAERTDGTPAGGAGATGGGGAGIGGGGGAGGDDDLCVSGLSQSVAACTVCQDAHCCVTASAAAAQPGAWTNSAAKICREANCATECEVAVPQCGGIQPSPASCTDDLYASCCAEVTACAQSDACTAVLYLCIDDRGFAPGSTAFNSCAAEFPGGLEVFEQLDACFGTVVCQ